MVLALLASSPCVVAVAYAVSPVVMFILLGIFAGLPGTVLCAGILRALQARWPIHPRAAASPAIN
jgi:H+/Cl- antiporter ClcA